MTANNSNNKFTQENNSSNDQKNNDLKEDQTSNLDNKKSLNQTLVASLNKTKNKNKNDKNSFAEGLANSTREKFSKFFLFINNLISNFKNEAITIREKSKDLLNTNFNLGLRHLEKGNISDAIFRFKFIIKFWPNHHDSHYQLSYCYFLQKRYARSKYVLENLLKINPSYRNQAKDLIDQLDKITNNPENVK